MPKMTADERRARSRKDGKLCKRFKGGGHGTGPMVAADLHTVLQRDRAAKRAKKWHRMSRKTAKDRR